MPLDTPGVLLIAYWYPPDEASGAARPRRFQKYLARLGHRVVVITAHTGGGLAKEGDVWKFPGRPVSPLPKTLMGFAERVVRKFALPHDDGPRWALRVARSPEIGALAENKPWVILSTAPPFTTHLAAWSLNQRFGLPWIADFRDPLAGNAYRHEPWARRVDPHMERLFFSAADRLIANTEDVRRWWDERYPQFREKYGVVWNGFDPEDGRSSLPLPERDHRTLIHIGSIYGARNPLYLLQALDRLAAWGELEAGRVRVRLLGPMSLPAIEVAPVTARLRAAGVLEIENRQIPSAQAAELTASSDYLLLLDTTDSERTVHVPAKLFEYARIGRPILACTMRGSPVERILQRSGLVYVALHPDLPEAEMDARLAQFLRLPAEARCANDWFLNEFDAGRQAEALSRMIRQVWADRVDNGRSAAAGG